MRSWAVLLSYAVLIQLSKCSFALKLTEFAVLDFNAEFSKSIDSGEISSAASIMEHVRLPISLLLLYLALVGSQTPSNALCMTRSAEWLRRSAQGGATKPMVEMQLS